MNHYVTLGANDSDAANAFYDRVLATIGWASHASFPGWRGYSAGGTGEGLTVWVCSPFDGMAASAGNGSMVGFAASSREQVDAFHDAALQGGGRSEGAPGPRPHYGPDWYSAYVRDPSGNKLAVVHNP
ncbi:VOC family protein [Sphingomonas sp. RP10(2022)]|uniref:VOC family protein n=1 Tax=Sphingomonas liriopis TaxID=2949094 RepID=A0A9X2HYR7_9SPHN|nr:VOC family protein [Sphingomonas liriopis]MCP3735275.1 VOC family protein [Sphingomonas liriopis]